MEKKNKKLFEEYKKNYILFKLRLYKIFMIIFFIINILLIIFYIEYKKKLNYIFKENFLINCELIDGIALNDLNKEILESRLINLFAVINEKRQFSNFFNNISEFNLIKKFVFDKKNFKSNFKFFLIYKSNIKNSNKIEILNSIKNWLNFIFLIKTEKGKRFGFYINHNFNNLNYNNEYKITNKDCFLFSLNTKNFYNCKDNCNEILIIPKEKKEIFRLGNKDLIIFDNFLNNNFYWEIPKNFEIKNDEIEKIFIENDKIKEFEILSF